MIVESPLPPVLISVASLADFYQSNLVGPANGIIEGPYGKTRYVYADWTASGQSLRSIEDQIQTQVLPYYANTHTEASHSGQQMTLYREQARAMVKTACHATDDDVCIFTGSGATGAIQKLIDILEIRLSPGEQSKAARDRLPDSARPIVLIGPWEHHSNLLDKLLSSEALLVRLIAWRETSARVIEVPACPITGSFSYDSLSAILREISSHPQSSRTLLGSFSAASNVTGITLDIPRVSRVIHEFGGIAVFDCAAWASHLKPDMNPVKEDPAASPDAIFMSPHKLAGGPGCPGILLAKKRIIRNSIPGCVGGGVVELVTRRDSIWISDIETREEAGTPDIVGSIRCGLVFALKSLPVRGQDDRLERSHTRLHRAWARWSELDDLVWLGAPPGITHRVPIISFQIKGLDMGFVNTLLSDLFGIQARDGCFCAHPYIADLLNMTDFQSNAVRPLYIDRKIYRQGATRVSFPWFMSEEDVTYVIEAVAWISEFGWKFLPEYQTDLTTAKWTHRVHTRRVHMLSYSELFNVETRTPLQQDSCVPRPTLDDTIKKLERHIETFQSPISLLSLLKDKIPIGRLDQFRSFATPLEGALVRASAQSRPNHSLDGFAMAERAAWHDHLAVIATRNLPDIRAETRETKVMKSPFVSRSTLDTVPILSKGPTGKRRSILSRFFKKHSETLVEPVTVGHATIG